MTLFEHIREYQDSHGCSDDDMIRMLCDWLNEEPIAKDIKKSFPNDGSDRSDE